MTFLRSLLIASITLPMATTSSHASTGTFPEINLSTLYPGMSYQNLVSQLVPEDIQRGGRDKLGQRPFIFSWGGTLSIEFWLHPEENGEYHLHYVPEVAFLQTGDRTLLTRFPYWMESKADWGPPVDPFAKKQAKHPNTTINPNSPRNRRPLE